jgi:sugar phosphate isomerase/epimerase
VTPRRFAVCEFSTLGASFEEDLAAYAAAGFEGISICELKLVEGREAEHLAAFRESSLAASSCIPTVPSILPLPLLPGPEDPEERVEAIRAGIRRLAPFEPSAIVCLTGPPGERDEAEARRIVVKGLRAVAEEAERSGVPVGLEPMNAAFREDWSLPATLGEAAALLEAAGHGRIGLTFDTWHVWNTPAVQEEIRRYADRIVAVHVNDWREPTRGWCDRVLPGDGVIDLQALVAALEAAGWDGFYDLEIFSDNGAFGTAYPDSLWDVDAAELARRGHDSLTRALS